MKILKSVLLLFIITAPVFSQSAEKIVDSHIKALGGQANIDKIQSMKMEARMNAQGMEIPMVQYVVKPDKLRMEIVFSGMTMIQTYNGKEGWKVMPFSGSTEPEKMNDDEVEALKEQVDFAGSLASYKKKGGKLSYVGKEDLEGTEVHVLKVSKDTIVETFYLDASSFMIQKQVTKVKQQDKEVETETYLSNYKEIEGLQFPFSIETKMEGTVVAQVTVDKIELNQKIDDTLFDKPATK